MPYLELNTPRPSAAPHCLCFSLFSSSLLLFSASPPLPPVAPCGAQAGPLLDLLYPRFWDSLCISVWNKSPFLQLIDAQPLICNADPLLLLLWCPINPILLPAGSLSQTQVFHTNLCSTEITVFSQTLRLQQFLYQ